MSEPIRVSAAEFKQLELMLANQPAQKVIPSGPNDRVEINVAELTRAHALKAQQMRMGR